MPILGVTWIVGLLAVNEHTEVFAWIFTMLNSLQVRVLLCVMFLKCFLIYGIQGFFIFFFYVLRKEKVRIHITWICISQ